MKKYLPFIFFLAFLIPIHGQEENTAQDRHPYLGLTFGIAGMKVKDALVMPVRYSGTNIAFGLNYLKLKAKSSQEISFYSVLGGVNTGEVDFDNFGGRYREPNASLYYTDFSYTWQHAIAKLSSDKYRTFLGATAHLLINARYNERWDNSAINYEGAFSPLAVNAKVERDLRTWKKSMTVSFGVSLPIFVYVMRPEFSGVPDFLDHETDFISSLTNTGNSKWTGLWEFPHIKTRLDIALPIRGENFMKFSYLWEYYSYQEPMKTQFGGHHFLFTLYTHL